LSAGVCVCVCVCVCLHTLRKSGEPDINLLVTLDTLPSIEVIDLIASLCSLACRAIFLLLARLAETGSSHPIVILAGFGFLATGLRR
jgi:hypothetical protein